MASRDSNFCRFSVAAPTWVEDDASDVCQQCATEFAMLVWRQCSTSKDGKKNASSRIAAKEANKLLHSQLKSALKTTSKQLDDWMHMQKFS